MRRARQGRLWLALILAACGVVAEVTSPRSTTATATPVATIVSTTTSSSSTTSSTSTTSTTTTSLPEGIQQRPVPVPGSSIVVRFEGGLAPAVLASIENTLPLARRDLGDAGSLVVHVYATVEAFVAAHDVAAQPRARADVEAGSVASTTTGTIWIYGPRYAERDAATRRQIVFHEYFHTVQLSLSKGRSNRSALWLIEGSARYFEFRTDVDLGFSTFDRPRETQIRVSRGLGPLQSFEADGGPSFRGGGGEAYTLGFLATDYLVSLKGVVALKRDLWIGLSVAADWRSIFSSVFGISTEQFYADFEAYRQTL